MASSTPSHVPSTFPTVTVEDVVRRISAAADGLPSDARGVVAFDGDGTLWSGDVAEDVFYALLDRGLVREPAGRALVEVATAHGIACDAGAGAVGDKACALARDVYGAYLRGDFPEETVCEVMTWIFAGWSRTELTAFIEEVLTTTRVIERLQGETRALARWAEKSGFDVYLVSASPRPIVEVAGALCGIPTERVIGATPLYDGAHVAADVERPIPYGPGKLTALRAVVGDRKLLAAFGDNVFDVPMLREAAVAAVVRPKARLIAMASELDGIGELERRA